MESVNNDRHIGKTLVDLNFYTSKFLPESSRYESEHMNNSIDAHRFFVHFSYSFFIYRCICLYLLVYLYISLIASPRRLCLSLISLTVVCCVNHCDYCHWQIHNNLLHVRRPQQKPCSCGNMSKYLPDLWKLQRDRWLSLENRNSYLE